MTGGDTDARSDLYGLGALFAELVSLPQAPPWFRDLVHQLRREKPDERPESAEEVLAVLQSHERDLAISHWFRQFLQRTGRSLGRAAIAIVPLAVVGTAIDVGMGSRFTNTALTGFGFGGIAVSGQRHLETGVAQVDGDQFRDRGFVLDDEHSAHGFSLLLVVEVLNGRRSRPAPPSHGARRHP